MAGRLALLPFPLLLALTLAAAEDGVEANEPGSFPDPYEIAPPSPFDPEKLFHHNVLIEPGARLVFADGRLTVHPRLLLGAGYDDNPDFARGGSPDSAFLDGRAGIDATLRFTQRDQLGLQADAGTRDYLDGSSHDQTIGSGRLNLLHAGEMLTANGTAFYRRTSQPYYRYDPPADRQQAGIEGRLTLNGRSWFSAIALSTVRDDWLDATSYFDSREYDSDGVAGDLRVERRSGLYNAVTGWVEVTSRRYDEDTYNDVIGLRATGGARIGTGTRSWLSAELGVMAKRYADDFMGDPAYDDREVIEPLVRMGWFWSWAPHCVMNADTFGALNDDISSNAVIDRGVHLNVGQRVGFRHTLGFETWFDWLEDSGAASGQTPYRRQQLRLVPAWEMRVIPGMVLRAETTFDTVFDDDGSWHRLVGLAEVVVVL